MEENIKVCATKRILCVIKDAKSEVYYPPSCSDSADAAKRSFAALIRRQSDFVLSTFPSDFDLWMVGEYDDRTGTITPAPAPVHLANGSDFAKID